MITEAQREELYECARTAGYFGDTMLKSLSGADQADSEAYFCERRVYLAVVEGVEFDSAFAVEDARWRAYATEQKRKVDAAPKTKRGPMSGQSVISHRWVDLERFAHMKSHIRFMVKKALSV